MTALEPGAAYVQSLARGLAVIRAFDAEHPRMTLSELAGRTGLTRATARRFLLTLVELGYVTGHDKQFSLTPHVLELGFSYLSALTLPELAQPHLETLARTLGESTSASVLDGDQIVYVARVPTRRIMNVAITIGTRFTARQTSMGRVLLAARDESTWPPDLRATLHQVREQGWAIIDQELEHGIRAIAAPLHAPDGTVTAAINVSTTAASASLEHMEASFRPALLEAAARIDAAIAATSGPAESNHIASRTGAP